MPRIRYNCGHVDCTMWHSSGHKPYNEVCPSIRLAPPKTLICQNPECGKTFTVQGKHSQGRNRFCSGACRVANYEGPHIANCENCGKDFRTTRAPGSEGFPRWCSWECRYPNPANTHRDWKTRADYYGVEFDPTIKRDAVMVRDDWTCALCGDEIPDVPYFKYDYNPLYGTVDHIVPLSKGGAHVWSNVQAAHHTCNTQKGASLPVKGF